MLLRRVFFVAWMIILHSEILCQVQPDHLDNHINREKEDEEDDEDKDPYDGRLKFPPFSFSHNDIMEQQKNNLKGDSDFLRLPYKGFPKHGSPPQDCDGEVKSHDDDKQGDHLSPTSYKVYGSPYQKNKDEDNEEQPSDDHSNNKHPHEHKGYRSPGSYLPYGNEFYKQRQSFIKTGNIKKPHSEKTRIHDGVTKDKRHTGLQVYY